MLTMPDQTQLLTLVKARRLSSLILLFMAVGTLTELFLLEHFEDQWQLVPIILIGASLLLFVFLQFRSSKKFIAIFNGFMVSCALSGCLGTWFHFKANMEFESELHPKSTLWSLLTESLTGALPALAPGSMIVFALLGYLYTILILKKQQ